MVEKVCELLAGVAKRPQMYVHQATLRPVRDFLYGLRAGCGFGGLAFTREEYAAAGAARGWRTDGAIGILWHLEASGLPETTLIQELIAIEIDAYRRAAARAGENTNERTP